MNKYTDHKTIKKPRQPYESVFSLMSNQMLFNQINMAEYIGRGHMQARIKNSRYFFKYQSAYSATAAIELLKESGLDDYLNELDSIFGKYSMNMQNNVGYLISPTFRYCPDCIESGIQLLFHQIRDLNECPVHHKKLIDTCQHCGSLLTQDISSSGNRAFECPHCGHSLLKYPPEHVYKKRKEWDTHIEYKHKTVGRASIFGTVPSNTSFSEHIRRYIIDGIDDNDCYHVRCIPLHGHRFDVGEYYFSRLSSEKSIYRKFFTENLGEFDYAASYQNRKMISACIWNLCVQYFCAELELKDEDYCEALAEYVFCFHKLRSNTSYVDTVRPVEHIIYDICMNLEEPEEVCKIAADHYFELYRKGLIKLLNNNYNLFTDFKNHANIYNKIPSFIMTAEPEDGGYAVSFYDD